MRGMRGGCCVVLLCLTAALTAFAQERKSARVSLTSQPAGATVLMDGVRRGVTPLMLFGVEPGRHHLKYRLFGHVDRDVFLTIHEGEVLDRDEILSEERGLLILKTDPPACNIRVDGLSVGETPRFIGNLSCKDPHEIRLSKAGYQDQTISVRFNGREPLVREEKMVLDSGVLDIVTDPPGAEVTVNGLRRGLTPVCVRDLPKGSIVVKFVREGYRDETREIRINAGEKQTLSVSLAGLPGTMHLLSSPPNAAFYVNGEARGHGPVTIPGLKPGDYVVRCEKEGFGTLTQTVSLGNGETVRKEFKLSNVMGRIEVRSLPAGADVFLDGRRVGTTIGSGESELSNVFSIENVMEGEHQISLAKDGYQAVAHTVNVEASQTAKNHRIVLRRVFVPNVEIETRTGSFRGVFKRQDEQAIVIETKPGTEYPIPRQSVRKVNFLRK